MFRCVCANAYLLALIVENSNLEKDKAHKNLTLREHEEKIKVSVKKGVFRRKRE